MKSRIQTPDCNQLTVVLGLTRQVPKSNVPRWANLHDCIQRAECEPTSANFLLNELLIGATNVRPPARISHACGRLHSNDRRSYSFRRSTDVASPKDRVSGTPGVGRP